MSQRASPGRQWRTFPTLGPGVPSHLAGYSGGTLALYAASFLVAIISTSVLITFFCNRSGNIFIAVWIHFLFNFLFIVVMIDAMPLVAYTSITYVVVALLVVAFGRKAMMRKPASSVDPS